MNFFQALSCGKPIFFFYKFFGKTAANKTAGSKDHPNALFSNKNCKL
jgi:hypothetical protein